MKTQHALPALTLLAALVAQATVAADAPPAARTAAPAAGATLLGGALPGGAILSARSVLLQPVAGGPATAVPLAANGSFSAAGLAAGDYKLKISSTTVPKQTQGATFGEKVQSGLQATGSALAQGAAKSGINGNNSMPNRISMNVTVARRTQTAAVDGEPITVTVGQDGKLEGSAVPP